MEVTTTRGSAVCQFLNIQPEILVAYCAFAFNRTSIRPECVTEEGGVLAEEIFVNCEQLFLRTDLNCGDLTTKTTLL
jgi:hypothetical protein